MAEGFIGGPSGPAQTPARGIPSDPVTVVSWQAEVSSVLPPATEIQAYERSIPNAGERLLVLVELLAKLKDVEIRDRSRIFVPRKSITRFRSLR